MTKPNLFGSLRRLWTQRLQTTLLVPLLFLLGLSHPISAQDCSFLTFSYSNAPQPCCYQLKVNNSISECHPFVRVLLDGEVFASWTANAGWTGNQTSPSEIIFTHSSGQVPFGNSTIATLCLPLGATADLGVLWDFTCGIGTGCTTTLVLPDCNDPSDGSITGTLYAECGTSGYSNQPPLANQTVQLFNNAGELLAQEVSDANGFYAFYDRPAGQYIVKVVTTPGWTPSVPASGQYAFTLNISQQAVRNFGICVKGSISGVAYLECGGAQYSNQTTLPNRTIQLLNAGGTVVAETTTNASGAYTLNNLTLGNYTLRMVGQPGWTANVPPTGQYAVSLTVANNQLVRNFGACAAGSIAGVVYQTCDSVPYSNQPPVPNQLVLLFNVDNVLLSETLTDTSGAYAFSGLPPGNYYVKTALLPGWTSSVPATGQYAVAIVPTQTVSLNFGVCSLPGPVLGCNCPLNSTPGANLLTNPNFSSTGGFTSDYTFDNTGVLTSGEYWIAPPSGLSPCGDHTTGTGSAFVAAGDAAGGVIPFSNYWLSSTISVTPNTNYVFSAWVSSLGTPNNVAIILEANGSTTIGQPLQVTNTGCQWKRMCGVWNSGSNTSVNLAVVSVVNSQTNHKLAIDDLSFRQCSGFGVGGGVATGRVYQTCDTLPAPNQPALAGWVVQLLNATGTVVGEQLTDADGAYGFYDLTPGQYVVRVANQPGWTANVPPTGQYAISITQGGEVVRDFSFCAPSIAGVVYLECDDNPYTNQALLSNQTVQVLNAAGELVTQYTTGDDGTYAFFDLPPGQYIVRVANQPGWTANVPPTGQLAFTLTSSTQRAAGNFGLCNYSCDCNLITPTVTPAVPGNGTCCYSLSANAPYYVCFQSFEIQVDAGLTISPSSVTAGWTVTTNGPQSLTVTPPANLPGGVVNPLSFCVSGGSTHNILVLTRTLGIFEPNECPKFLTFSCSNAVPCDVGKPRITTTADGSTTTFTGEVELGTGTTIVSAVWDFGDGTQDSSCCVGTVSHTYEPGIYTACLTVTGVNADGAMCSDSACVEVRYYVSPCLSLTASLQPSGLNDCCFPLTINTTNSFYTQINVNLSSGTYVNSQLGSGNWSANFNGSSVEITPGSGGFLPLGASQPITICDPMGNDPYAVTVDVLYNGGSCPFTFGLSCGSGNCTCTGFQNLEFYNLPGLPNIPVICDPISGILLPCIGPNATYQVQGNFGCQGSGTCPAATQYQIFDLLNPGPALLSGTSTGTYFTTGAFNYPPGSYKLVLTGLCGSDACPCVIYFTIPAGCDCGCSTIETDLTPISVVGSPVCCYQLGVSTPSGQGYNCYQYVKVEVPPGLSISSWNILQPGWTVTPVTPQYILVNGPGSALPPGTNLPISFCVSGGTSHNIQVTAGYIQTLIPVECSEFFHFVCGAQCYVDKPRIATTTDGPTTTFTGEVDLGEGTTLLSAVWDFGDGTQDSSCCVGTVSHTYEPGIYTACLTVTGVNAAGEMCSDSACVEVRYYNPCNDVSASLQSSGLGDCCYTLTVGNTLANAWTHIEVTLSSGNFSNTQILNNNWLVAINGSTATLTPVGSGGYVPVGTDMPLSICDPQGTDPYTVTVSFVLPGGGVCSRTLTMSCSPDDCACTGFANVEFYNFLNLPNIPVTCNDTTVVALPCIGSDATYQLQGNFGCQGSGICTSSAQYQISSGPNSPVLFSGSSIGNYFTTGGFTLPPGTYQLVLTGQCGANTCTCTVNFTIPAGCDCTPACLTNSINVSTGVEPGLGLQNPGTVSQMWSLIAAPPSASLGPLPKPANFVGALAGWPTPAASTWMSPVAFNNSSPYTCTPSGSVCSSCDPFVYERCFCLCENSAVSLNFDVFATGNLEVELWAAGGTSPIATYSNCASAPNANLITPFTLNANLTLNKGKYCLRIKHWSASAAGVGINVNGAVTGQYLEKDECCTAPTGCLLVRKFNDLDCNGTWAWNTGNWTIQEPTLSGWGFTLTNTSTSVQYTGFTNAVGEVYFCVPPGTYSLVEMPQGGWTQTSGPNLVNVNASGVQIVEVGNCQQACTCQTPNLALTQNGVSYPVLCNSPASVVNLGCPAGDVTLSGSFGCENPSGAACPQSPVVWNLYGPNGFVTQGVATGPTVNLQFLAASVSTPGLYTLNLATICQGELDSCRCTAYWIQAQCSPCCTGTLAAFLNVAQNVQTFGALGTCNLSFQAVGLTNCLQITYGWGDNTTSGPVGDNVLVSHTYAQSGTYLVCYTIEELDASGNVCHTFTSCEQVSVICNDCVCGSFSELFARPTVGGQGIPVPCGEGYTFGCPPTGHSIPITGKFECVGNNCNAVTTVNWTLTKPSGGTASGSVQAGPYFLLNILPVDYAQPGTYTLVLTGNCGGSPCPPCTIQFTVNCPDPCPCDPTMVPKKIDFATALWLTCKGCFTPIGLNDCDAVTWTVDAGPVLASTVGGQTFCHVFSGPGQHVVTMNVIRYKSDGSICQQFTVTKTVNVTCLNGPDCGGVIVANPRFSEGAVSGPLGNGGVSEGWTALSGEPLVLEGQPAGTLDGWAMHLTGNYDQSDVLASTEVVCVGDTGTVSIRLAGDPIPGVDVKLGRKPPGGSLAVQVFQGNTFSTQNCTGCYRLALIQDLLPLDSGEWVQIEIPYDLSNWAGADTCGGGTPVRFVVWVTSPLGDEQGGSENGYQAQLDNFCVDGQVVSVTQPSGQRPLRIVPNPNAGTFTVELPVAAAEGWQLRVLSATGQLLKTQAVQSGSRQQTVQANELPSGLYLLQVVSEGRVLAVEKWVRR